IKTKTGRIKLPNIGLREKENLQNVSATADQDTIVFLTLEGVRIATKGYAEQIQKDGFAPLKETLNSFIANGGKLWACGACTKPRGITDADLAEGAKIVTAANLVEVLAN